MTECETRGCGYIGTLEPVQVREFGRFAVRWYCHRCAAMIRAFNGRGKA